MKIQKLLYIIKSSPYSTSAGQEALDALLIGAAFEQQVSVLFLHDGVFQIKQHQQAQGSNLKQYTKTFGALEDFGVEHIYAHDQSLFARGLCENDLMLQTQILDNPQIAQLIEQQYRVLVF